MHLELDWELPSYKHKVVQGSPGDEPPDNSILRCIAFASKSLSSRKKRYGNIERETLGTLYGLQKYHP